MTPINFIYWLQGFLEISKATSLTEEQVTEIRNHIALVLKKETPVVETRAPWTSITCPPIYEPTQCRQEKPLCSPGEIRYEDGRFCDLDREEISIC